MSLEETNTMDSRYSDEAHMSALLPAEVKLIKGFSQSVTERVQQRRTECSVVSHVSLRLHLRPQHKLSDVNSTVNSGTKCFH